MTKYLDETGTAHLINKVKTELNNKENTLNKVTSVSSTSTDTQYPTAKCLYDLIGDVEQLIEAL